MGKKRDITKPDMRGRAEASKATQFKPVEKVPVTFKLSTPLEDVLHVLTNPEWQDVSPGQKAARKLLKKDYKAFTDYRMRLEEAANVAAAPVESQTPPTSSSSPGDLPKVELDDGSLKAVGAIDRLLEQLRQDAGVES